MSAVLAIRTELEQRAEEFGRELAWALVLAGERAGRDRRIMREMTAVAGREMRAAVEWLRVGDLPERIVQDYERACRKGFQAELHFAMRGWRDDQPAEAAQQAA